MSAPVDFSEYKATIEKLYKHKIDSSKVEFLTEFYAWTGGARRRIIPSYWYVGRIDQNIQKLQHDYDDELEYIRSQGIYPIMYAENGRWLCISLYDKREALLEVDLFDFEKPDPATLAYDSFDSWILFAQYCFENSIYLMQEKNGEKNLRFTEDPIKSKLFDEKYKEFNPTFGKLIAPY